MQSRTRTGPGTPPLTCGLRPNRVGGWGSGSWPPTRRRPTRGPTRHPNPHTRPGPYTTGVGGHTNHPPRSGRAVTRRLLFPHPRTGWALRRGKTGQHPAPQVLAGAWAVTVHRVPSTPGGRLVTGVPVTGDPAGPGAGWGTSAGRGCVARHEPDKPRPGCSARVSLRTRRCLPGGRRCGGHPGPAGPCPMLLRVTPCVCTTSRGRHRSPRSRP